MGKGQTDIPDIPGIPPEEMRELHRRRDLYQKQLKANTDADSNLRNYVFEVMKRSNMLEDIKAVTDMIHVLPSGYTRYNLCAHYFELKKKQSLTPGSQDDLHTLSRDPGAQSRLQQRIGDKAAQKLRRLCRLFTERDKEFCSAAAALNEYGRQLIAKWDPDASALKELLHHLPTGELFFEIMDHINQLERQEAPEQAEQANSGGEGGMTLA